MIRGLPRAIVGVSLAHAGLAAVHASSAEQGEPARRIAVACTVDAAWRLDEAQAARFTDLITAHPELFPFVSRPDVVGLLRSDGTPIEVPKDVQDLVEAQNLGCVFVLFRELVDQERSQMGNGIDLGDLMRQFMDQQLKDAAKAAPEHAGPLEAARRERASRTRAIEANRPTLVAIARKLGTRLDVSPELGSLLDDLRWSDSARRRLSASRLIDGRGVRPVPTVLVSPDPLPSDRSSAHLLPLSELSPMQLESTDNCREAVPELVAAMSDTSPAVRMLVAGGLAAAGADAKAAVPSLLRALTKADGPAPASGMVATEMDAAAWALGAIGEPAHTELAKLLAIEEGAAAQWAALALACSAADTGGCVSALLVAVEKSGPPILLAASAVALGRAASRAADVRPALDALASDESPLVRISAIKAIGLLGPASGELGARVADVVCSPAPLTSGEMAVVTDAIGRTGPGCAVLVARRWGEIPRERRGAVREALERVAREHPRDRPTMLAALAEAESSLQPADRVELVECVRAVRAMDAGPAAPAAPPSIEVASAIASLRDCSASIGAAIDKGRMPVLMPSMRQGDEDSIDAMVKRVGALSDSDAGHFASALVPMIRSDDAATRVAGLTGAAALEGRAAVLVPDIAHALRTQSDSKTITMAAIACVTLGQSAQPLVPLLREISTARGTLPAVHIALGVAESGWLDPNTGRPRR